MKIKIIIAFIALITSIKAKDTTLYISGPHGGLLQSVENYKIEVINTYGCIAAYLFDGTLKIIPNKFTAGNIMFFFNNRVSLNKYLIPNGTDGFTADISNADYHYYTIYFKINKKIINARFENFSGIADKDKKKIGN